MTMSKNLNMSVLMDFYGQLLTEKQRESLEFYYNDDLSLSEIADQLEISRQGVRDFIKRGEKQLSDLEEKLGLAERFADIKDKINEINRLTDKIESITGDIPELEKLKSLSAQVVEKL